MAIVLDKDLSKVSDDELQIIHDNLHTMLLKGEIGEEDFGITYALIKEEMNRRGLVLPPEEERSSPGEFEQDAKKDMGCDDDEKKKDYSVRVKTVLSRLNKSILKIQPGAVQVHGKAGDHVYPCTISFDQASLDRAYKGAALQISETLGDHQDALRFATRSAGEVKDVEPLFDVYLVPSQRAIQFHVDRVNIEEEDYSYFYQLRHTTQQAASAARSSIKRGVTPGKFFRAHGFCRGVSPEVEQSVADVAEFCHDKSFPMYIIPASSDHFVQVHKKGDHVSIWSRSGKDLTRALPHVVSELCKVNDEFVGLAYLDGTINTKVENQHDTNLSSFEIGAYLDGEVPLPNDAIELVFYDCLYLNGSNLCGEKWRVRHEAIDEWGWAAGKGQVSGCLLYAVPNAKEIVPNLNRCKKNPRFSQLILQEDKPYDICHSWPLVKFQRTSRFNVVVVQVADTYIPGVRNFSIAADPGDVSFPASEKVPINGSEMVQLGTCLSTRRWSYPGDIIEVEAEAVLHEYDKATGESRVRAYKPRVINKVTTVGFPHQISTIIGRAVDGKAYFKKEVVSASEVRYISHDMTWRSSSGTRKGQVANPRKDGKYAKKRGVDRTS